MNRDTTPFLEAVFKLEVENDSSVECSATILCESDLVAVAFECREATKKFWCFFVSFCAFLPLKIWFFLKKMDHL